MLQAALLAGEVSGDRVAGQLATALRRRAPELILWGTGGKYLAAAGAEVVVDASQWGVVGMAAALRLLPRVLLARRRLLTTLSRRRPELIVAIDAGALHLGFGPIEGVLPWARRNLPDTRILYYFPPGSWRRQLTRSSLGPLTDAVATPFPWSEAELRRLGVNATFVGHPLLDLVMPALPAAEFAQRYGLDPDRPVVGILPGSRRQEIEQILPVQLAAAAQIHRRVPGVQFLLALAPTVDRESVERQVRAAQHPAGHAALTPRLGFPDTGELRTVPVPAEGSLDALARRQRAWIEWAGGAPGDGHFPVAIVDDQTYDLMAASDVLLCKSGTATLEAAILHKPMVIVYRMSRSNLLEYQFVKKRLPEYIGMPNLLAGQAICPELVQEAATAEALANEVIGLLLEPDRLMRMQRDLRQVVGLLGEPGGAERTAQMALDLLAGIPAGSGGA